MTASKTEHLTVKIALFSLPLRLGLLESCNWNFSKDFYGFWSQHKYQSMHLEFSEPSYNICLSFKTRPVWSSFRGEYMGPSCSTWYFLFIPLQFHRIFSNYLNNNILESHRYRKLASSKPGFSDCLWRGNLMLMYCDLWTKGSKIEL